MVRATNWIDCAVIEYNGKEIYPILQILPYKCKIMLTPGLLVLYLTHCIDSEEFGDKIISIIKKVNNAECN